jgi:hypothetical protein
MSAEEQQRPVDDGSPLGRYQPPQDPAGDPLVHVVLQRLPVKVVLASREHHDDLMREYRLLALAGDVGQHDAPARLVELVQILGEQYASAASRRDAEMEQALAEGRDTIDQVTDVPPSTLDAVRQLRGLMDESDRYCREAQLLTVPRPPLVRRFADWYFDEFERQLQGGPPTPWDGPLDL